MNIFKQKSLKIDVKDVLNDPLKPKSNYVSLMATSWLDNPSCHTKIIPTEQSIIPSIENKFKELYQKAKHTDWDLILRDHEQDLSIKIHRAFLIVSCEYFEKIWGFDGLAVPNPLVIIVEDAFIAQKIIEEFYGLVYTPNTTQQKLMYMIVRDFFSLGNDYHQLFLMQFGEDDYDLLLRVIDTLKPNGDLAKLLIKIFFPKGKIDFEFLQKYNCLINPLMSNLMLKNNQRYELVMQTTEYNVLLWNTFEDKYLGLSKEKIFGIAYSADASRVVIRKASTSSINSIQIWCTMSGTFLEKISFSSSQDAPFCISPDYTKIIYCTNGLTVVLWNRNKNILGSVIDYSQKDTHDRRRVSNLSFTPNQKYFIITTIGAIHIYDGTTFGFIKTIYKRKSHWQSQIISPNSLFYAYNLNADLVIISLETFQTITTLSLKTTSIVEACYTADSHKIITYCADDTLRVWDAIKGELLDTIEWKAGIVKCIACPDSMYIIVGTADGFVHFLDATSYEIMKSEKVGEGIYSMAVKTL